MSRQEAFEKIYAKLQDVTPDSLVQYRFCATDGYRLPQMASHYRVYCETMDSLAGELQDAKRYRWLRSGAIPLKGHDFLSTEEILDYRVDVGIKNGDKP